MRALIIAITFLALTGTALAQVQEPQHFPLNRLRLAIDGEGIINAEGGSLPRRGAWNALAWAETVNDPLVLYRDMPDGASERAGALVHQRYAVSLGGAYTLLPWLAVGADLPFVLYQSRQRDVPGVQGGLSSLGTAGLEDLRLTVKIGLLRTEPHHVNLALLLQGTVPTWTDHGYFVENTASFTPGLALSRALARGLHLAANASYRFRRDARLLDLRVGDELEFKAGAGWRFAERGGPPLELDAVLYAATAAASPFQHQNRDAVEALGHRRRSPEEPPGRVPHREGLAHETPTRTWGHQKQNPHDEVGTQDGRDRAASPSTFS